MASCLEAARLGRRGAGRDIFDPRPPVPEFTYEPLVPDSDFNGFSVGLGLMCKDQALFLGLLKCRNSLTKAIGLDFTYVNQTL